MTYQQTLDHLYNTLPMFSRIGAAAYKEDLTNTIALCEALGNPQNKFKTIHVAGTNGKGSTCSMLAAVLQQSGYKTGLYTSPHIRDFGERIRINGEMIKEAFVITFVEENKSVAAKIDLSFFELTVGMAFSYFAEEKVDIAIIETGLGGRLDSTNIIRPELSVITNIGYDHMNMLGNTLAAIAGEKAGIIKAQVPVVIGSTQQEIAEIFIEKASRLEADIYFADQEFVITKAVASDCLELVIEESQTGIGVKYAADLSGIYQATNVCTVLQALKILRQQGFDIPGQSVRYALAHTKKITGIRGRWEKVCDAPVIIYDVAHNEDGIGQVCQQLKQQYSGRNYHFVLGFAKEKEVKKVLELFPSDAIFYFTNAHIPRAMPAAELQAIANANGITGDIYDVPADALQAARDNAGLMDVIVCCGSFFLIAELPETL